MDINLTDRVKINKSIITLLNLTLLRTNLIKLNCATIKYVNYLYASSTHYNEAYTIILFWSLPTAHYTITICFYSEQ